MDSDQRFKDESFMREARLGLTVLSILLVILIFAIFRRFGEWDRPRPVAMAPAATHQADTPGVVASPQPNKQESFEQVQKGSLEAIDEPPITAPSTSDLSNRTTSRTDQSTASRDRLPRPPPAPDLQEQQAGSYTGNLRRGSGFQPRSPRSDELSGNLSDAVQLSNPKPAMDPRVSDIRPPAASGDPNPQIMQTGNFEPTRAHPKTGDTEEPPQANLQHVTTKPGDSYWSIAQQFYGDGRYFSALYHFNRQQNPGFDELPGGTRLQIPEPNVLRAGWPDLCPQVNDAKSDAKAVLRIHRVQSGQSLFDVAKEQLGQASRYVELLELNRDVLPDSVNHLTPLKPDTPLRLPADRD